MAQASNASYWADTVERGRRHQRFQDILSFDSYTTGRCFICHAPACRSAACRAVKHFKHCGGFSFRGHMYGPAAGLWYLICYLKAMADGDGPNAIQFSKRFAHRQPRSPGGRTP